MKYIDAEKLKKIVEQAKQRALKGAKVDKDLYCNGCADAFDEVLLEITSLQQEQEQYVIGGQVFGATDVEQLYGGKVYIISNLVQDIEFGLDVKDKVKMLLIKD